MGVTLSEDLIQKIETMKAGAHNVICLFAKPEAISEHHKQIAELVDELMDEVDSSCVVLPSTLFTDAKTFSLSDLIELRGFIDDVISDIQRDTNSPVA